MVTSRAYFYSPRGLLFIEGADAAVFLQGQFSQDLRISVDKVAYGLWLNSKGKILADSFALKVSEQRFLALSYSSETVLIRENLENRIIMDEVETHEPESSWLGVSLWGDAIGLALDRFGLETPEEDAFSSKGDVYAFWGRRSGESNIEILVSEENAFDELKKRFVESGIRILGTNAVSALALRSGRFEVSRDIRSSDLPQETGLGESAVSYAKGCYIGQEVMARLKAMGQARRSLECVTVSQVPDGDGSWRLQDSEGRRVGELRRVVLDGEVCLGSAMLKKSNAAESFEVEGQPHVTVTPVIEQGEPIG